MMIYSNCNSSLSFTQSTSFTFSVDEDERADNVPRMIQGSMYHDNSLADNDRPMVDSQ